MKKKIVIIGLDGVSHSLLELYAKQGVMPQFKEILQQGHFHKMETSLPEVSSVAWTSFMTGKNPGEHGIFGFMELRQGLYEMYFPNYTDIKSPAFWESTGAPSVVINIPQTYPARPLHGVMVSGFVAVDLKKAVYPESAYTSLVDLGYKLDVNALLAKNDVTAFFADFAKTFEKRRAAIKHFFDREQWEIFIGTITETDRLHHFFYDSHREEGTYYKEFLNFYKQLDEFLGEMYRKAKEQGALFITCSDHGFTTIKSEVYLNAWLMQEGFLEIADKAKGVESITESSRAFCLDPSRIYVHLRGKYPRGSVTGESYEAVRSALKQKLTDLTFNGERVVKKIYLKEEIFHGPYAEKGPDLYVLPNYGFDLKGTFNKTDVFGTTHFRGMHTQDDAHLLISEPLCAGPVNIEQIAPLVCKYAQGE